MSKLKDQLDKLTTTVSQELNKGKPEEKKQEKK
jgi:hypothetical protein